MPKAYEPGKVEQKWYKSWMEDGYFAPSIDHDKKPFVIIMPPPNVTGELHVGHALTATLEDIMIRWHRMMGEPTLWLPGVDHASIAAQVVVEHELAKEGLDRHQVGREKFLERMWDWVKRCRHTITEQHQRLGVSCDWSRECFTLDDGPSLAVRTAFIRLYEKGLIYRGERIINWCPRCSTALSDLEVDHKDVQGHLWHIRYPLAEDKGNYIIVATTRPETMLGDTAVAVSPHDQRYKALTGKKVILPLVNREISIISDDAIDPSFGTGAVKITPSHDPVDFEMSQRQDLPLINILNDDATINENGGAYNGLNRFAAREAVVADLEKQGLLEKVELYGHSVGHCQRCQTLIEPLASRQWFVDMPPLTKPAIDAVTGGHIKIVPQRFEKVYLNWMENIRDWCISRQLWWGHRIPVWYCQDCEQLTVAIDDPTTCRHCGSTNIEQDPDVLDTWFSSALWPHSTLGWPGDTEDFRYFYPTTVMETGYDILFFWVARMIVMGLEDTDDIPFHTIYLHGLIRDEKGEKMSKVKGNVLNPLDTLEKYGTDALRFALSTGTAPGNDIKLTAARLETGRNFANKIWNASRFIIRSIQPDNIETTIKRDQLPVEDRWILSRLSQTISGVTSLMDDFQFGEAQRQLYDFVWGEFCDWYIEIAKIRLRAGEKATPSPLPVLVHVLDTSLRLLHPYMPFVTEELWQNLKGRLPSEWATTDSIMMATYPATDKDATDPQAEKVMASVLEIIHAIRNARAQYKVASNRMVEAEVYAGELASALVPHTETVQTLARAKPVTFQDRRAEGSSDKDALALVLKDSEVIIPMASMIDIAAEKEQLQKEIAQVQAEVARLETMLNNEQFLDKAPNAVVDKERNRLEETQDKLARLQQQWERFK
ncbi:valine--tRNA ligase [Bacteroidota bacterium]